MKAEVTPGSGTVPVLVRHALQDAILAAAAAAAVLWLAPPGTDFAAHAYQRDLFLTHGFTLWNNYWYAGRYSFVGYSLLYYPAAALVGIKAVGVASAAAAAAAFALVTERQWGPPAVWAGRLFALTIAAAMLTGAFPYAFGLAFALGALGVLQRGHRKLFACLLVLVLAASPLAFLLLVVVLTGLALSDRGRSWATPVSVVATGVAAVLLQRLFPSGGRFPFPTGELLAALTFATLGMVFTWRVPQARKLRLVFPAYGLACLVAFALPSPLGENIARLRYAALPLAVLILSLRAWRPLLPSLAVVALAFAWNMTPLAYSLVRSASDPSGTEVYWRPVVRYLRRHMTPSYRVEAVDTSGHWEALFLPKAGIPLVRGWFRQEDFPQNELLYDRLAPRAYRRWLRRLAVRFVVLTEAPSDHSAQGEAALLRSGTSGLVVALQTREATIYRVPNAQPIVSGPGHPTVAALGVSTLVIAVPRAGVYRVAVRYSPYWATNDGCVAAARDGMLEVHAGRSGRFRLRVAFSASRALAALAGDRRSCTETRRTEGMKQPGQGTPRRPKS